MTAHHDKTLTGLNLNSGGYWVIDKMINGQRLYKSTRKKNYKEAERLALKWIHEAEQQAFYGHAERITFRQAATLYLTREKKKSIKNDANDLKKVMPYVGDLPLELLHNESLNQYRADQLQFGGKDGTGAKGTTINRSLRTLSRVLTLAATEWRDDNGKPYLSSSPLIRMVSEDDKETTRPIEYHEDKRLLDALNDTHRDLWRFACHTGLREQTQINLRWDWERTHPKINARMFVVPGHYLKYGRNIGEGGDWLLVLNSVAGEIVERWRGRDDELVFPSPKGGTYSKLRSTHFKNVIINTGLSHINWHSARATFSTRLRRAGVDNEDRQGLMAHDTSNITTQYSWADIQHLAACVEKLCDDNPEAEDGVFNLNSLKKPVRRV